MRLLSHLALNPGDSQSPLGPVRRFTLSYTIVLIIVMVLLGAWLRTTLVRQAEIAAQEEVTIFLQGFLQPFLAPRGEGETASPEETAALLRMLPEAYFVDDDLLAVFALIRVWTPEGQLFYSSNPAREPSEDVSGSVRQAAEEGVFVDARWNWPGPGPDRKGRIFVGQFAPILRAGTGDIAAVVEWYQDEGFWHEEINEFSEQFVKMIPIVLAVLMVSLYVFIFRAGRIIKLQNSRLRALAEDSRALATRNAELREVAEASRSFISLSNDRYLQRLGAEIHDGPLQTLSLLLLSLTGARGDKPAPKPGRRRPRARPRSGSTSTTSCARFPPASCFRGSQRARWRTRSCKPSRTAGVQTRPM